MVVGHNLLVMGCLYIPQFLRDVKYSRNFSKGLIVNSMWDVQYLLLWNYDAVAMDHIMSGYQMEGVQTSHHKTEVWA